MRYIDLFAGAGGLSEGFVREGFTPVAHVEMNKDACSTIRTRVAYHYLLREGNLDIYKAYIKGEIDRATFYSHIPQELFDSVINTEISDETIESVFAKIDALVGEEGIDLVVGGPPCQAYSVVGRARKAKEGGMSEDGRNYLFKHYARFLERYSPKFFVFENVPGLVSAGEGKYLEEMCAEFKRLGYGVNIFLEEKQNRKKVQIFDTSKFGVLQKRERVIVLGCKGGDNIHLFPQEIELPNGANVQKDLFDDLPELNHGESIGVCEYTKEATTYQMQSSLRDNDFDFTTQHITRPHNDTDLEIYKIAIKLWLNERKRLNYADLPEDWKTHQNQKAFLNRFQVVNPYEFSHTMVAHIYFLISFLLLSLWKLLKQSSLMLSPIYQIR